MKKKYIASHKNFNIFLVVVLCVLFLFEGFLLYWIIAAITIFPLFFIPFVLENSFYKVMGKNLVKYSGGIQSTEYYILNIDEIKLKDDDTMIVFYNSTLKAKVTIKDRDSLVDELLEVNPDIIVSK